MNNGKLKQANKEMLRMFVENITIEEIANYNFRNERRNAKVIDGIVGFKEYKISNTGFDCDSSELTMSAWCTLLEKSKAVKEVLGYENRKIHYIDMYDKKKIIETDTMNSLETSLNQFIRKVISRKYGTEWHELYSKGYGIVNGEIKKGLFSEKALDINNYNRDRWLIQYYEEIFDKNTLTQLEIETLLWMEKWSNLIHTIGNFVLGPEGFNTSSQTPKAKGKFAGDRADSFLKSVQSEPEYYEWREQFSSIMDINVLDDYFEGNTFSGWNHQTVKNPRSGSETNWIGKTVGIIRCRGIKVARKLKENHKVISYE